MGPNQVASKRMVQHESLNVPIEHHPTIRYMVYNGYYKVMSNIPKMGQLPTPVAYGRKSRVLQLLSPLGVADIPVRVPPAVLIGLHALNQPALATVSTPGGFAPPGR